MNTIAYSLIIGGGLGLLTGLGGKYFFMLPVVTPSISTDHGDWGDDLFVFPMAGAHDSGASIWTQYLLLFQVINNTSTSSLTDDQFGKTIDWHWSLNSAWTVLQNNFGVQVSYMGMLLEAAVGLGVAILLYELYRAI